MSLTLLDAILDAQSLPREAQELSRRCQNGAQNVKKSEVKKQVVFRLDFFMVWRSFLIGFWMIFENQNLPKLLKTIFAKT